MADIFQAVGSHTAIVYKREASWGVAAGGGNYSTLNLVGGETLDNPVNIYTSQTIRSDRMRNPSVRGTRRPGGTIPFELAAKGIATFLQAALGGDVTTTGTGPYTHVFKGDVDIMLPSFTVEKQFTDLETPKYNYYTGTRVNSINLNFGIDQIVSGSMDVMSKVATMSATSAADGLTVDPAPVARAFTAVEAALYLDGVQVSVIRSMTLAINNNLYGDTGFVLGEVARQNLLAGTRSVTGNATFLFQDTTYYEAAVAGTEFELKVVATDEAGHSVEILLPVMQFMPNSPSPKIANDGPLELQCDFEALPDLDTLETDIQITVINDEATITV